tara:strand:+ start:72 stop:638 length:567 start_codon:yes stop_codon:yes gene_type:complete
MKQNINITALYIKNYIEELTGMDLAQKTRKREIVDARRVAFKLTKSLTKDSLASIGKIYNKDHATVLHGIKTFDYLYDSPDFKYSSDLYKKVYGAFLEIQENLGIDKSIKTLDQLHFEYRNKIENLVKNHREKMSNLLIQNERLKTNPMFDRISKLPETEFQDLQIRLNAFFQMNAMNSERKRLRNVV